MHQAKTIVLGGGMCGLGAALASQFPAYEATAWPGGVCYSYHVHPDGSTHDPRTQDVSRRFRFEPAGGHWMFGVSPGSLARMEKFAAFRRYKRQAAVYFQQIGQLVPFPLQDNLRYLDKIGHYGVWHFQGMLQSFAQGLSAGRATPLEITPQM
jgi:hypothetical protein